MPSRLYAGTRLRRGCGRAKKSIKRADNKAAAHNITPVVVIDRSVRRTEAVQPGDMRTSVIIVLGIDDRKMDLAVAAGNRRDTVLRQGKLVVGIVLAVPDNGMTAACGKPCQRTVIRICRVKINPVEADDNLVCHGIRCIEGKSSPGPQVRG